MKKNLLTILTITAALSAFSQSAVRLPSGFRKAEPAASYKNQTLKATVKRSVEHNLPVNNLQSRRYTSPVLPIMAQEYTIGSTFYDLQTNGAVSNHLVRNADGTASATWTFSPDAIQTPSTWPNRGAGYNYFDGSSWGAAPVARIGSVRTGFSNIAVAESGAEMTVQHYGQGLTLNWRATKGTGAWTTSYPWGQGTTDFWPKMIAAKDYIYAIWQGTGGGGSVGGQDGPIFFSRSTDGGQTWSAAWINPLIDSSQYLGFTADAYSIDADTNGNVAIAYSGTLVDVGVLKSSDWGQTWTKLIVQQHPIHLYDINSMITDTGAVPDGVVDTLNTNAGDAHVQIDLTGKVHVWFGDYRWYCDQSTPGSWNYFPSTDGLFYWNENMPTNGYVLIAAAQDMNGNGVLDAPLDATCNLPWGSYNGTLTEIPSSGIDENGRLYLSYQTVDESADTTFYHQMHKHIYMMTLDAPYDPSNWTMPYDIVPSIAAGGDGENQEAVFGSMSRSVNATGDAWILYQRDNAPGHALSDEVCDQSNNLGNASDIIVAQLNALDVGVNTVQKNDVFVSQNYPNPSVNQTYINVVLKKSADINITVTDMMGRTVYQEIQSTRPAGSNIIGLNTSNWSSGTYLYTVIADGQKVSKQMVVR